MVPSGLDQTQSYRFRVDGIDGSQKTSLAFQPQNGAFLERPSASPLLPDCLSGFWCNPLVTWLGRCNKVCQGLPPPPWPKLCVGCS
jgi:hypothetical protein